MNTMPNDALNWILKAEGGYVNNKFDAGGATNKGITQSTLKYAHIQGLVKTSDIKLLTNEDCRAIYNFQYWIPSHAGELPLSLGLVHFDCAVNCGVTQASKSIRRAVNAISPNRRVDETSGMVSELIALIMTLPADDMIKSYLNTRLAFYRSLGNFKVFGTGWTDRLTNLAKYINVIWAPSNIN